MNKAQVAELMEKMYAEENAVRNVAQKEYAHSDEEACGNFKRIGAELGLDPKVVLWVYFKKHLDGILAHINGFKSQREDVRGRIKDARVYLVLLRALIEDEEAVDAAGEVAALSFSPQN